MLFDRIFVNLTTGITRNSVLCYEEAYITNSNANNKLTVSIPDYATICGTIVKICDIQPEIIITSTEEFLNTIIYVQLLQTRQIIAVKLSDLVSLTPIQRLLFDDSI